PVLGYTTWRDPPKNNLDHLKLANLTPLDHASLGVAVEGASASVAGGEASLPRFDTLNRQRCYVDVFNRGSGPLEFTVKAVTPWVKIDRVQNPATGDTRLWITMDQRLFPAGLNRDSFEIIGAGSQVRVNFELFNPAGLTRDTLEGFVEDRGVVAIEPEHYSRRTDSGANRWLKVDDYGRTLSGMRAMGPVDAPSATPGKDSPCLEYRMYLFTAGPVEVTAITAPTLNFVPDRGVRYAVSFDDEAPQVVTLVPQGYQGQNRNPAWEKSVGNNAHYGKSQHAIATAGYHTLKVWMIDPAVVMQKLVVDLGGLKPSYLGPPESFHRPARQ
ncbi:MAG TPA: hypothetical protein VG936_17730, partial [Lacunisphaera sp.]|nr:hypothetical protein [Lacunisphaera sp.]